MVVFAGIAFYANVQRNEAERRGRIAHRVSSRLMPRIDWTGSSISPLLGVEATRAADTFEARSVLMTALNRHAVAFLHGSAVRVTCLVFSADDARLASGHADGTIVVWDSSAHKPIRTLTAQRRSSPSKQAGDPRGRVQCGRHAHLRRDRRGLDSVLEPGVRRAAALDRARSRDDGARRRGHGRQVQSRRDACRDRKRARPDSPMGHGGPSVTRSARRAGFADRGRRLQRRRTSAGVGRGRQQGASVGRRCSEGGSDHLDIREVQSDCRGVQSRGYPSSNRRPGCGDGNVADGEWCTVRGSAEAHGPHRLDQPYRFSPDDRSVATASSDRSVGMWIIYGSGPVRQLLGHQAETSEVAFSHDGRWLASAGRDGQIVLWDTSEEGPLSAPLAFHSGGIDDVAFRPDGQRIVVAKRNSIELFERSTRRPVQILLQGPKVRAQKLVHDATGALLGLSEKDGGLVVWDFGRGVIRGVPRSGLFGYLTTSSIARATTSSASQGQGCPSSVAPWRCGMWQRAR